MKSPDNTEIHKRHLSTIWFDKDGILYSVFNNVPRTVDTCKERGVFIKFLTKDKLVCSIVDVSNSGAIDIESREHLKNECSQMYKALAIVTTTPLGQMIASLWFVLAPHSVPTKIFSNEPEANKWIQQYL